MSKRKETMRHVHLLDDILQIRFSKEERDAFLEFEHLDPRWRKLFKWGNKFPDGADHVWYPEEKDMWLKLYDHRLPKTNPPFKLEEGLRLLGIRTGHWDYGDEGPYDLWSGPTAKWEEGLVTNTIDGSLGSTSPMSMKAIRDARGWQDVRHMLNNDPEVYHQLMKGSLDFQIMFVKVSDIVEAIPKGLFTHYSESFKKELSELGKIWILKMFPSDYNMERVEPWGTDFQGGGDILNLRRLTQRGDLSVKETSFFIRDEMPWEFVPNKDGKYIMFVLRLKKDAKEVHPHQMFMRMFSGWTTYEEMHPEGT